MLEKDGVKEIAQDGHQFEDEVQQLEAEIEEDTVNVSSSSFGGLSGKWTILDRESGAVALDPTVSSGTVIETKSPLHPGNIYSCFFSSQLNLVHWEQEL